jgi:hypothetical protein
MDSTLIKFFGSEAVRVLDSKTGVTAAPANDQLESIVLSVIVLLLFSSYITMLYRHRRTIIDLFKIFSLKDYIYKIVDQAGTSLKHLNIWSHTTAVLAILISVARANAQFEFIKLPTAQTYQWIVPIAAAAAGIIFISAFRYLLLKIIGLTTGKLDFIRKLSIQNSIVFTIAVVTTTPAIILGIMSNGIFFQTFSTMAVILLIINILVFTKLSLKNFIDKKISIFQWFLYLCGVEIMPFSFLIALVMRM